MGSLFDTIAPAYGLFYRYQMLSHRRVLDRHGPDLGILPPASVLDVGCGTGALCAAWNSRGFTVTGVDRAPGMLAVARAKTAGLPVALLQGDVLVGLPFPADSFDYVIASHVAHGLQKDDRARFYMELRRLARRMVIVHDFSPIPSRLITLVERLERSDYHSFIASVETEMAENYSVSRVVSVGRHAAWYIGMC